MYAERPVATFNTAPIFPFYFNFIIYFGFEIEAKRRLFFRYLTGFLNTFKSLGSLFIKALQAFCWKTKILPGTATQELYCHLEDWEHRGRHDRGMNQVRSSNFIDKNYCDRLPSFEQKLSYQLLSVQCQRRRPTWLSRRSRRDSRITSKRRGVWACFILSQCDQHLIDDLEEKTWNASHLLSS